MGWKKNITNLIEIQKEGGDLFDSSGGQVLYEYATGVGKSKQAIDNIAKDDEWWVICCWENAHIENWIAEFKEWKMEHLLKRVHIICYASLKSYFNSVGEDYKINMVCDEAHHMFSETYFPYIIQFANKLQMLTATLPTESRMRMRQEPRLKDVKVKKVPLSMAIKLDILPTPAMFIVPVSFDSFNRTEEIVITRGPKAKWEKITPIRVPYNKFKLYTGGKQPLHLIVSATQSEKMRYYDEQVEFKKQMFFKGRQKYQEVQMKLSGAVRKRYIAEVKTNFAKAFIEQYVRDRRAIIFCGSVDQAINLGGELSVHSRRTDKQNKLRIQNFQEGKSSRIYTNRMLREGVNLAKIEVAVMIQLDNKNLAFVQMAGRALRANFPELFIFNIPNTQDDKYLENSLVGIDRSYVMSIDDYELTPEERQAKKAISPTGNMEFGV